LNKHEIECGFQPSECPGCKSSIAKKELENHKRSCAACRPARQDANVVYNRGGASRKTTDSRALNEQIRQLREELEQYKNKIQLLTNQLTELQTRKSETKIFVDDYLNEILFSDRINQEITIAFDDLPSAAEETKWVPTPYRGLKWTKVVYMDKSYALETYPKSGYVTAFMPGGSPHVAFFNEETSFGAINSNETFSLISLSACTAWTDNLHLTITAFRNSVQVNTHTSILLFGKPQMIVLLWRNIDKIVFQPSGGIAFLESDELEKDTHCVITQLTIEH
jgi:hypothetical protein